LKYIDDRGEELTRLLNQFKSEFDEDRRLRLEREEVIVKQLTDHEQEVSERFEQQIVSNYHEEQQYIHWLHYITSGVTRIEIHRSTFTFRGQY